MAITFCEFNPEQKNALKELFDIIFHVEDFSEINEIYNVFKKDFPGPTVSKPQTIERKKIVPRTCQTDFLVKYEDYDYQIGVDLPVLFSPDNTSTRTVFIVAEDPLRDFKNVFDGVRLSTPFGLHMKEYRDEKIPVYWGVIENLLNKEFNVYVTDIFKLWIKRNGKPKEKITGEYYEKFRSAFNTEIRKFKPELIVTYGNQASLMMERIGTSKKCVPFPHPARTANGKWKETFTDFYKDTIVPCTDINKITYINSILQDIGL